MAATVTPAATYSYRCLGPARLEGPGGRPLSLKTRKVAALLYLLARQPGKAVAREEITELFWPGYAEAESRHSLAQTVSLINKELGGTALETQRAGGVTLREGLVALDVTRFEAAVKAGDNEAAHALWGGRLLEGLSIPRVPDWEQWLAVERARVERLYRGVLHALGEKRRSAGDWEGMERTAETLLALDSLDEKAMLLCLESMSLRGDRVAALRAYEAFSARLQDELGAQPCPDLVTWVRSARSDNRRKNVSARASGPWPLGPMPLPSPKTLFGREHDYERLWTSWKNAFHGSGSCTLLSGPAGIGKTAIVSNLASQVLVAGGSVCYTRCYRTEQAVPFAPLSDVVNQLSRLPGFVATNEAWISELSRIATDLRTRFPNAPPPQPDAELGRFRLCDALLHAAAAVADEHALLIVVDDIQYADEATVAALHFLARHCPQLPLATVFTSRSYTQAEPLSALVDVLIGREGFQHLGLGPLTSKDTERLISHACAAAGFHPAHASVSAAAAMAGGNPLKALELAIQLAAPRAPQAHGRRQLPAFEESVTKRYETLSQTSKLVLKHLAVADRPLSSTYLAALVRVEPRELHECLAELTATSMIKSDLTLSAVIHEEYISLVDRFIDDTERSRIHFALARAIEQSTPRELMPHYEVALHYEKGGHREDAARHAVHAVEYARQFGSVRELARALEISERVSTEPSVLRQLELAECYVAMGEWRSLATVLALPPISSDTSCDRQFIAAHARLAAGGTTYFDGLSDLSAALELPIHDTRRWRECVVAAMRAADKLANYRVVRRLARRLRRSEKSVHCDNWSSQSLFAVGYVWCKYYDASRAVDWLQRAADAASVERHTQFEAVCREGVAISLLESGRYKDAIDQQLRSVQISRKSLNPLAEANALLNTAVAYIATGDFEEALAYLEECARIDNAHTAWVGRTYRLFNQAVVAYLTSNHDSAIPLFLEAAQVAKRAGVLHNEADCIAGVALSSIRTGRVEEAQEHTRGAVHIWRQAPYHHSWAAPAAYYWSKAVTRCIEAEDDVQVARILSRLHRCHAPLWLQLRLELLEAREYAYGTRQETERARLGGDAERLGARHVAARALS